MGKSLLKDTLRRIWKTRGRFFAIMAIIAIGCGFFAGIKVTSPDMKKTADLYYKNQNLMDIQLVSTLGFNDAEIEKLAGLDDIQGISGEYSADMFIKMDDGTSPVAKVYSIDTSLDENSPNYINRPVIEEGRMPEAPDECLIETKTPDAYKIGDTITLETQDPEAPVSGILKYETFKIVGRVSWVKYVDFQRGTTTIGNGSIGSYLIVPKEAFAYDYYTDVYIKLRSTDDMDSFSDEYSDRIKEKSEELEKLAEEIHSERINESRTDIENARSELSGGESDYNNGMEEFNSEITSAENQLNEAKTELENKEKELNDGIAEYSVNLAQYNAGVSDYAEAKRLLEDKQAELSRARTDAEPLKQLYSALESLIQRASETAIPADDANTAALISSLTALDTAELPISTIAAEYAALPTDDPQKAVDRELLSQTLSGLASQIENTDAQLAAAQEEIDSASAQITLTRQQLDAAYEELVAAKAELDSGLAQLEEAKTELEKNESELADRKADGEQELSNARTEIDDGREELLEAEEEFDNAVNSLKWYVLDRNSNTGYSSFGEDADRVDSIATVFPIFFILVAALVCLTTMTRMVEEQRTEIGTLKALGYGNSVIMAQFLFYAASASIIGAAAGLLIGFHLFPKVIFQAYMLMYYYPDVICEFRWDYAAGCTIAALLCTGLSSIIACYRELTVNPAQLMRPKPPKSGKRVLLENIKFIWNRMSFNSKVTARNVFRYKNRVLMTVLGIGGCTALMLAGFGLRYAISVIVDLQFGDIFKYDAICTFSAEDNGEYDSLYADISENTDISEFLFAMQKSVTVTANGKSREAFAIVPEFPDNIGQFITMRDRETHETFSMSNDGVIINEKLAKLLNVQEGDTLSLADVNATVIITAITENYSNNYVYFTPEVYKNIFGNYENNIFYVNIADGVSDDSISGAILENGSVMSVNFMKFAGDTFRKLVKSLNAIVVVIIASSGALAFVVLYNLSNINITERMRELATIKVLGFYDYEVASYIYRENVVSAVLGMAAGLFGGIFLTRFVVQTSEVDVVMFCPDIPLHCFVCAALLTLLFTAAVNALLYFKLRKIDMAGSMKAIE